MSIVKDLIIGKLFGRKVLLGSLLLSAGSMYLKNRRNRNSVVDPV